MAPIRCFLTLALSSLLSGVLISKAKGRSLLSIEEKYKKICNVLYTCDIRIEYCNEEFGSCESCEEECGETALERDPGNREHCNSICQVYLAQVTTTQAPTKYDRLYNLSARVDELQKNISQMKTEQSDAEAEHNQITSNVNVVLGMTSAGVVLLVALIVIASGRWIKKNMTPHTSNNHLREGQSNIGIISSSPHTSASQTPEGNTPVNASPVPSLHSQGFGVPDGACAEENNETTPMMMTMRHDETQCKQPYFLGQTATILDQSTASSGNGQKSGIGVASPTADELVTNPGGNPPGEDNQT